MRKVLTGVAGIATLLTGGAAAFAQNEADQAIASDQPGALDAPETWNCRKIRPEYSDWLEDGNAPESWRYVGKTYRDVDTGDTYTWQDWLDWSDRANCAALADAGTSAGASQSRLLIGAAITAFGTGLIAASGGSGPKSPG